MESNVMYFLMGLKIHKNVKMKEIYYSSITLSTFHFPFS